MVTIKIDAIHGDKKIGDIHGVQRSELFIVTKEMPLGSP